jgi:ATP-dependent DNA helicase PIF1
MALFNPDSWLADERMSDIPDIRDGWPEEPTPSPTTDLDHVRFLCGPAGTGKTTMLQHALEINPRFTLLCATTGIAAVNLASRTSQSPMTVNSALGYFDTASLKRKGYGLVKKLRDLREEGYERITIDEISMMPAEHLEIITRAANEIDMPILLTGDFAQLPPVEGAYAFTAECWPYYREGERKLTRVWRQDENDALTPLLRAIRKGDSDEAYEVAKNAASSGKIYFASDVVKTSQSVALYPRNVTVDEHNDQMLWRLLNEKRQRKIRSAAHHMGIPSSEWKHIPASLELAIGAQVMILANARGKEGLIYANGDVGELVEWTPETRHTNAATGEEAVIGEIAKVRLYRNDSVVEVGRIRREHYAASKEEADRLVGLGMAQVQGYPRWIDSGERWSVGTIEYMPLRLAWASTIHKTQGLTLSSVQVDIRHQMMGTPGMLYVALSRCKSAEGLTIVGKPQIVFQRANASSQVLKAGYL